jgi:hypothetical protein
LIGQGGAIGGIHGHGYRILPQGVQRSFVDHHCTNNVGWMALDSGAALRVHDLGDNARVSIPKTHLHHPDTQAISE